MGYTGTGVDPRTAPTGTSWVLRYRFAGRSRQESIGTSKDIGLTDAREKARSLLEYLDQGIDPRMAAKRQHDAEQTVQALYDTYTSGKYFKSRSDHFKSNFKSAMRRYVLPALGEHAVGAVQDWQIERIVNDLIDADKEGMARGRLTHCKVLFRAGKRTDLCADIKPEYTKSGKRDRWRRVSLQ